MPSGEPWRRKVAIICAGLPFWSNSSKASGCFGPSDACTMGQVVLALTNRRTIVIAISSLPAVARSIISAPRYRGQLLSGTGSARRVSGLSAVLWSPAPSIPDTATGIGEDGRHGTPHLRVEPTQALQILCEPFMGKFRGGAGRRVLQHRKEDVKHRCARSGFPPRNRANADP